MKKEWVSIFVVPFVAVCVASLPAWAGLENPVPQSVKSGVSVVSGWICDAEELEVSFDGGSRQFVPYGSERSDTASACGDTDNGFGLLINYNDLGDGEHTITLYVDGRVETTRTFFVGTFGEPFLRGVNGVGRIALSGGQSVVVGWSEAIQGFTILGYTDVPRLRAFGSFIGTWRFTGGGSGLTFTKTYQLSFMETNMAHQGITHLRGTDGEDQQAVFFLEIEDLLPGFSSPYTLTLSDPYEENTQGSEQFCIIYTMNATGPSRLEGRAYLSGRNASGCQPDILVGNPDGYPFSAQQIE